MDCKNCNRADIPTREELERIVEELSLSEVEEYNLSTIKEKTERLNACSKCEALAFGVLCTWCGCFVQIRSRKKENDCPHPVKNHWSFTTVLY